MPDCASLHALTLQTRVWGAGEGVVCSDMISQRKTEPQVLQHVEQGSMQSSAGIALSGPLQSLPQQKRVDDTC